MAALARPRLASFSFIFCHIAPTLQFRKQRIPRATMHCPSIFAEGDYRRVRLTHPNRLVKYCRRESYPYVCTSPGAFICRAWRYATSTHRNTKIDAYANGAKIERRRNDKTRDDGIYCCAGKGDQRVWKRTLPQRGYAYGARPELPTFHMRSFTRNKVSFFHAEKESYDRDSNNIESNFYRGKRWQ